MNLTSYYARSLEAIAISSLQHLTLHRVQTGESFDFIKLRQERGVQGALPLRTLDCGLFWAVEHPLSELLDCTSFVRNSLLTLCAPTLDRFSWSAVDEEAFELAPSDLLTFPKLREFRLDGVSFKDTTYLSKFIPRDPQCHIRVLSVAPDLTSAMTRFFKEKGRMSSLRSFIWELPPLTDDERPDAKEAAGGIAFLKGNTQISKFQLGLETDPAFLHELVLPVLADKFKNVISVSLTWQSDDIAQSSLELLGPIPSLVQLHISAGERYGWEHSWFPDHDVIIDALKNLTRLRMLALSRDTYDPGWAEGIFTHPVLANPERYALKGRSYYDYMPTIAHVRRLNAIFTDDGQTNTHDISESTPGIDREVVWEAEHEARMRGNGQQYSDTFRNLEHLYIEKLLMTYPKTGQDPQIDRSLNEYKWLNSPFGWPYPADT